MVLLSDKLSKGFRHSANLHKMPSLNHIHNYMLQDLEVVVEHQASGLSLNLSERFFHFPTEKRGQDTI
jgi:hypothetical protein